MIEEIATSCPLAVIVTLRYVPQGKILRSFFCNSQNQECPGGGFGKVRFLALLSKTQNKKIIRAVSVPQIRRIL